MCVFTVLLVEMKFPFCKTNGRICLNSLLTELFFLQENVYINKLIVDMGTIRLTIFSPKFIHSGYIFLVVEPLGKGNTFCCHYIRKPVKYLTELLLMKF